MRIDGRLIRTEFPPLNKEILKRMIYSVLTDPQKANFEKDLELEIPEWIEILRELVSKKNET